MSLFTIDRDKCAGDGICAAVCPLGIINTTDQDGYPEPMAGAERLCIQCGHCLAVCPQGALTLESMKDRETPGFDSSLLPSPEQLELAMRARRSVRRYRDKMVPREMLAKLIDIARYAPTGSNTQPVHWLVINEPDEVRRLAGLVIDWMRLMIKELPGRAGAIDAIEFNSLVADWDRGEDRICRGAPHLIIAHAGIPQGQASCTIALTYLELAAFVNGLGACWAGYLYWAALSYPPLQQSLDLPSGHQCYGALMIGYPQYRYHRIPARKEPSVTWR